MGPGPPAAPHFGGSQITGRQAPTGDRVPRRLWSHGPARPQAFNTFIDDVFAFIITMPTSHRLACFRDDVVFLVYLYQRW